MLLNVERLHPVTELGRDIESRECDFPKEMGALIRPVHLEATVRKVGREVVIDGRISTALNLTCSRCLQPSQVALDETFEVTYLPEPAETKQMEEIELEEAEMSIAYYQGDTISLSELVREQILLLLPVKPLCKSDCAGLCPTCGKDLNNGRCECSTPKIDPRLAVLQQLLTP